MQSESDLVWTVTETSAAGETVVGVFRELGRARDVVSRLAAGGRLEDYRIEGHAMDRGKETDVPWQVLLDRDGAHVDTLPFVACACADDEVEFRRRSCIDRDGGSMSLIVFAPTPGLAIAAARRYHAWVEEQGLWAAGQPLQPILASVPDAAGA